MEEYNRAVARGKALLVAMNASPEAYPQSPFTTFGELAANGWSQKLPPQTEIEPHDECLCMYELMQGHNLALDAASNIDIHWKHDCEDRNAMGANIYEETGGEYQQTYNIEGHTILVTNIRSPRRQLMVPHVPIPPLNHWSDVTYLQWAELCKNNANLRQSIQRVVHCDITNDEVQRVINRALGGSPIQSFRYPGRRFVPSDGERFEALLGTASLSGIAHMLAQHKHPDQLGWKIVESISVWCATGAVPPAYCAVVNIVDKD